MRVLKAYISPHKFVASLIMLLTAAGCASTTVSNRNQVATGYLPRPAQIWVYDFAATPADVPPESSFANQDAANAAPQTAEQIDEGRKLASQITSQLVQQIRGMGLPAANGSAATRPQVNDILIQGAIVSIQQGSATKRVAIGFSSGQSEMKVAVEGLQMTANGPRKLGSGDVSSAGNKTPGTAVGLAVLIATSNPAGLIVSTGMKVYGEKSGSNTVEGRAKQIAKEIADALQIRFQQQGWISAT
jgi:Domain of unknown function (DUF4410)